MAASYVPDEADIIWLNFTPQSGHEQAGRRPAVVLSPKAYNSRAGLVVCVPVTKQIKGYPFEVVLSGAGATGAALADQVKSLDWRMRRAGLICKVPRQTISEVIDKLGALLLSDS